ncbi:MAG: hypothetical protein Kow006_25270 [Gammaproteobacteria bacterium]
MGKKALTVALLAAGLSIGTSASAAEMASPSMLANTCAGCHGTNGVSHGPATPSIAGMSKIYFVNAMLSYKYGEDEDKIAEAAKTIGMDPDDIDGLRRPSTIMARIAKGYTDAEIGAMADFFSRKTFILANQKTDSDLARKGKSIHKEACEKCHEEGGRKGDGSGILAGQWIPYLKNAMMDFTEGHRDMPKKMRSKVKELSDKDFEALIHYYGSQK